MSPPTTPKTWKKRIDYTLSSLGIFGAILVSGLIATNIYREMRDIHDKRLSKYTFEITIGETTYRCAGANYNLTTDSGTMHFSNGKGSGYLSMGKVLPRKEVESLNIEGNAEDIGFRCI